jgi:uncharacterized damage-inducible protein DinB
MSHNISQALLPEYDHEMANTRKTLERVPEGRGDFHPHVKSMTLAKLAGHLVQLAGLGIPILGAEEFDFNPPGGQPMQRYLFESRSDALAKFDAEMKKVRTLLANTPDDRMMDQWSLKSGGHTFMSMPRVAMFRSMVMNHTIHHRAQLGVYLRLNDVPVPGLYGPSADEQ